MPFDQLAAYVCVVCFAISIIMSAIKKDFSGFMGWFCALIWCLNALARM